MSDLRHVFDNRWDALKSVVYPEFGADSMIAHEPMVWDAAHLIQRQEKELERLRRENEVLKAGLENLSTLFSDEYIITTDKISNAWALGRYYTQGKSNQDNHRMAVVVEGVLAELGIVRCEGCGGSGTRGCDSLSVPWKCPDCNGEGWVMKDETHPLLKSQGLPSPVGAGALEEEDE